MGRDDGTREAGAPSSVHEGDLDGGAGPRDNGPRPTLSRSPPIGGPQDMKTLLIVFHSLTGGTRQMAEAAARGAASESEVRVRLLHAPQAEAPDVLAADG